MFTDQNTTFTEESGLSPLGEAVTRRLKRIGHKGAHTIEPGNTLKSFDAALEAGVDMIEFDVVRHKGELRIAHGPRSGRKSGLTLEVALAHLSSERFADIELDVDMKFPGYENELVEALSRYDLIGRSIVCSQLPWSLARIRKAAPELRLGWSIPGGGPFRLIQGRLARRAARGVAKGRYNSIMAHWKVATPSFIKSIDEAGGDVYAWTVDEAPRIAALAALGVAGIVSNDPRLFGALA